MNGRWQLGPGHRSADHRSSEIGHRSCRPAMSPMSTMVMSPMAYLATCVARPCRHQHRPSHDRFETAVGSCKPGPATMWRAAGPSARPFSAFLFPPQPPSGGLVSLHSPYNRHTMIKPKGDSAAEVRTARRWPHTVQSHAGAGSAGDVDIRGTVRARRGRLSGLSVFLCKSVCGAFAWARRALNSQKRRFPARAAVDEGSHRAACSAPRSPTQAGGRRVGANRRPPPPDRTSTRRRQTRTGHGGWRGCGWGPPASRIAAALVARRQRRIRIGPATEQPDTRPAASGETIQGGYPAAIAPRWCRRWHNCTSEARRSGGTSRPLEVPGRLIFLLGKKRRRESTTCAKNAPVLLRSSILLNLRVTVCEEC
jgi:hypothetical protein